MNEYENEVADAISTRGLSATVQLEPTSSKWFQLLANRFPADGSKVDWGKVDAGRLCHREESESESVFFLRMFGSTVHDESLTGRVVYIGDSATEFAIRGAISDFAILLPVLFEIPQHHYLLEETGRWCMAFTMEGDFGFGFSSPLNGAAFSRY